jgi:hypothetical protein
MGSGGFPGRFIQQFLYLRLLPQGQSWLRPILAAFFFCFIGHFLFASQPLWMPED